MSLASKDESLIIDKELILNDVLLHASLIQENKIQEILELAFKDYCKSIADIEGIKKCVTHLKQIEGLEEHRENFLKSCLVAQSDIKDAGIKLQKSVVHAGKKKQPLGYLYRALGTFNNSLGDALLDALLAEVLVISKHATYANLDPV